MHLTYMYSTYISPHLTFFSVKQVFYHYHLGICRIDVSILILIKYKKKSKRRIDAARREGQNNGATNDRKFGDGNAPQLKRQKSC